MSGWLIKHVKAGTVGTKKPEYWQVGYYAPDLRTGNSQGKFVWMRYEDHPRKIDAEAQVHYLNGGEM
jgi:hypothetical protein